jgi:thioredoxin-related protein
MESPGVAPAARRRAIVQGILACGLAGLGGVSAPPARAAHAKNLPPAKDLRADGAASTRDRLPVLLFFDRDDCPYCERALRQYLVPMSAESPWKDRAIYRQVEIDQALPLIDFDGTATTHRAFAERYKVTLTPTIVMVDSSGVALGPPLVGLMTPDFYAAYVEKAIEGAGERLRG